MPCQGLVNSTSAFRPALTTANNMKINANPRRKNLRTRCIIATFLLHHPASQWTEGFSQGMSRKAVTTPGPLFSTDAAPALVQQLARDFFQLHSTSFHAFYTSNWMVKPWSCLSIVDVHPKPWRSSFSDKIHRKLGNWPWKCGERGASWIRRIWVAC